MTVRAALVRTCDRCVKVFEEIPLKPGGTIPLVRQKGLRVLELVGDGTESKTREHTSFEDLCPKCLESVVAILSRLSLGSAKAAPKAAKPPKDPDAPKATRKPRKSKDAEVVTEVEEVEVPAYSEDSDSEASVAPPEEEDTQTADRAEPNRPAAAAPETDAFVKDPLTGELYNAETGELIEGGQSKEDELPF